MLIVKIRFGKRNTNKITEIYEAIFKNAIGNASRNTF